MHEDQTAEDTALQGDIDIRAVGSLVLVVALGICIALGYSTLRRSLSTASEARLMVAASSRVQSLEAWFAAHRARLAEETLAFSSAASGASLEGLVRHLQSTTGNPLLVVDPEGSVLASRVPPYSTVPAAGPAADSAMDACAAAGQPLTEYDSCMLDGSDGVWIAVPLAVSGERLRFLSRISTAELEAVLEGNSGPLDAYLLMPSASGAVVLGAATDELGSILAQGPAGSVLQGGAGIARTSDATVAAVLVWRPLQSLPWGVVVSADPDSALAPARQFLIWGLLVLVIAVPVTYLLLAALARTTR